MRRIFRAAMLAAILGGTGAPVAFAGPFAPVVYINQQAVTQYELDQRLRFLKLLRAPDANEKAALQALVDDRLKMAAAGQLGIAVSDAGLEEGLAEFAGRANMGTDQFIAELARGGVDRQAYRDFIKSGVAWREVVRQRIVPTVRVSDAEVEQALTREILTPIIDAVLLSELIMPAPPGSEAQAMERARQLTATVASESEFAAAARRYSATPTAGNGGRLPWTPLANLPPSLQPILLSMKPGQISQPLSIPGAVVLFFLRDTRGTLRPGATGQTVDYVTLRLPSAGEGARIAAVADSCDDVFVQANRFAGDVIARQTAPLGAVPADIAQRLASLDDNEASVIDYGAGATLVMLCKRTPTLLADSGADAALAGVDMAAAAEGAEGAAVGADAAALPARDEVRQAIFSRKVNEAAEAYLAELRADALIRKP